MTPDLPITGPSLSPASGDPATSLVVLLHGVGADGFDLIELAPHLAKALPHAAFVAPHAPFPCDLAPYGRQWFSLQDRSPPALLAGVRAAAPRLDAFLDEQLAVRRLGPERLALVGFSQGCMMALHVGPRRAVAPAAVLGYSGALAGAEVLAAEAVSRPPVLLIHGDEDPVVAVAALGLARDALDAAGFRVEAHVRPGLDHAIDAEGVALGAAFLAAALGGGDPRERVTIP